MIRPLHPIPYLHSHVKGATDQRPSKGRENSFITNREKRLLCTSMGWGQPPPPRISTPVDTCTSELYRKLVLPIKVTLFIIDIHRNHTWSICSSQNMNETFNIILWISLRILCMVTYYNNVHTVPYMATCILQVVVYTTLCAQVYTSVHQVHISLSITLIMYSMMEVYTMVHHCNWS